MSLSYIETKQKITTELSVQNDHTVSLIVDRNALSSTVMHPISLINV